MNAQKLSVRNIDYDLILEARIHGLQTGQTLGEIVNRSLVLYLDQFDEAEEDHDCTAGQVV